MRRKSRMARLKPPRARFHEFSAENDIRYRGLLTYQHFQFLGWLCIAAVQAAFLMRVCGKADPAYAAEYGWLQEMLESMGSMSLPLLLIANFAQILDDSDGYRRTLLKNVAASLLICGLSSLLFYRYLAGAMARIGIDPAAATPALEKFARTLSPTRFEAYNIFIDLLMCSLVMFFLNYRPKRVLRPWARLLFRLLALLPVAYEVGCMMLKVMSSRQLIDLPFWAFSLLPVKPPMTFVLFLILAVFIKTRELRFRRHGKTHEDYQAFLRTNRNARNFSFFLAAMILLVSFVDYLIYTTYSTLGTVQRMEEMIGDVNTFLSSDAATAALPEADSSLSAQPSPLPSAPEEEVEPDWEKVAQELLNDIAKEESGIASALGFGGSVSLLWLIPPILLFSYTRRPRLKKAGVLIPPGTMVLILFLYLETGLFLMSRLHLPKVDIVQLTESLSRLIHSS